MKLSYVRETAAATLVFGHIIAIFLVFFYLHSYFESVTEKLEIVMVLSPLTGLFALAGLKSILSQYQPGSLSKSEAEVSTMFSVTAISIPAAFIVFIVYTIISYPFGVASDAASLRMTLGSVEVALGTLTGAVAEILFGVDLHRLRNEMPGSNREHS